MGSVRLRYGILGQPLRICAARQRFSDRKSNRPDICCLLAIKGQRCEKKNHYIYRIGVTKGETSLSRYGYGLDSILILNLTCLPPPPNRTSRSRNNNTFDETKSLSNLISEHVSSKFCSS